MNISHLIEAVEAHRLRIGDKALEELLGLGLDSEDLAYSVLHGEIAEEYNDRPYPACLIHGPTLAEEPVHSVWAHNPQSGWAACLSVRRPVAASGAGREEKPR
jgi:hypothetical protein